MARPYRGRYVLQKMMGMAEGLTAEAGLKYLAGEITLENRRVLELSRRAYGFIPERMRIVKRVGLKPGKSS